MTIDSNFERVLLKRNWRTPLGRFPQSEEGIPVEIPKKVLRRYPLPSDATIVGPDYISPHELAALNDSLGGEGMTPDQIEAEILQRVEAHIKNEEARKRGKKLTGGAKRTEESDVKEFESKTEGGDDILDNSIDEIVPLLDNMDVKALQELKAREEAGKTRKGLMVHIDAALEDKVGAGKSRESK